MKSVFSRFKFKERSVQYLALIGVNIGMFSIGSHSGWPSSSIPILTSGNSTIHLTTQEGSLLISMTPLAVLLGCVVTTILMKLMGRKTLLLLLPIPLIASWLFIGFATSKYHLYIGRGLAGFLDAAIFNVSPAYLSEIADPEVRGLFGTTLMVSFGLGIALFNVFVTFMSSEAIAYIIAALTLLMLITLPFVPESPYYCLLIENTEEAKNSLRRLRGNRDIQEDLDQITNSIAELGDNQLKVTDMLRKKHFRRCVFIVFTISCTQYLSGNYAIQAYFETIFEDSTIIKSRVANCIYYVIFFVASMVSPILVDSSGRKPLLLISSALTTLTLFAMGIFMYFKSTTKLDTNLEYVQLLLFLLQAVSYSAGLHTVPWLVASELFPSNLVGAALGMVNIIYGVSMSATVFMFERTYYPLGNYVPFFLYAVFCIIGMVLIAFFLIETKGKTLEEIQREIRRSKPKIENNSDLPLNDGVKKYPLA